MDCSNCKQPIKYATGFLCEDCRDILIPPSGGSNPIARRSEPYSIHKIWRQYRPVRITAKLSKIAT